MDGFEQLQQLWQGQAKNPRASDAALVIGEIRHRIRRERRIGILKAVAVLVLVCPVAWWLISAGHESWITTAGIGWSVAAVALVAALELHEQRVAPEVDHAADGLTFVGQALTAASRRDTRALRHARFLAIALIAGLSLAVYGLSLPGGTAQRAAAHAFAVAGPAAGYAAGLGMRRRRHLAASRAVAEQLREVRDAWTAPDDRLL